MTTRQNPVYSDSLLSGLLAAVAMLVIWRQLGGPVVADYLAVLALASFILFAWSRLAAMARLLLVACGGVSLLALWRLDSPFLALHEQRVALPFSRRS